MTTVKTRNASLVRRQLSECIRQATLCIKELDEITHGEDDDIVYGRCGDHKGKPGAGGNGNGDQRDGGKTQRPLLDGDTFTVTWKNKTLFLGDTFGFKFLERLARCPNRYITHADFLEKIWEVDEFADTDCLRSVVKRLRVTLRRGGMGKLADAILGYHGHYVLDFATIGRL